MALPYRTTGSLSPTFVLAPLVCVAIKHPYAFTLYGRFPSGLRLPSRASVTIWEATAPVKLPARQCPAPCFRESVRNPEHPGWYFNVGSAETAIPASQPPTYSTQNIPNLTVKLQLRFMGSFRLAAGRGYLHPQDNFAESLVETAGMSLRHSCRSELTRQGISLP